MPAGRPSDYTQEKATFICESIAKGAALYKICEDNDDMPAEGTVYRWLEQFPEFQEQYARARARQADREADEIKYIADNATDANLARLQVDARKWRASKLAPKKYGDKIEIEQKTEVSHSFNWDNLDSDEASTLVALMKKAAAGVDRGKANGAGKPNGRVH